MRIESLTSLRFVFFVFIFLSHYKWEGEFVFPIGGPMGVSFFFILSGFSLSAGYGNRINGLNLNKFLLKRIVKVYPMHLFTLSYRIVTFLLIPLFLGEEVCKKLFALFLNVFLLQSWVPDKELIFSYNTVAWFLSPIIFFYILFPFLYKKIEKVGLTWFLPCLVGGYLLAAKMVPDSMIQEILYVSPIFRSFDFGIGIIAYRVFNIVSRKLRDDAREIKFLPYIVEAAVLICIAITIFTHNVIPPHWQCAFYYWLPMSLIIISLSLVEVKVGGGFLLNSVLKKMGSASYEMYMIHAIIISFFQHVFDSITQGKLGIHLLLMIVCLICVVLLGLLCHKINNRVIKWINL